MNWENCRSGDCCLNFYLRHNFTFLFRDIQKYRSIILQNFNIKKYNFGCRFYEKSSKSIISTALIELKLYLVFGLSPIGICENGTTSNFLFLLLKK